MTGPSNRNEEAERVLKQIYADLNNGLVPKHIEAAANYFTSEVALEYQASFANILVHHYFSKGDYSRALVFCEKWLAISPDDPSAVHSLLSVLTRLKRWDEVISVAREHIAKRPGDFRLHSLACQALGRVGRLSEARAHGTLCLSLKDQSAKSEPLDLTDVSVPTFAANDRAKNIISFSLFGGNDKYIKGAITNVRAARFIYPSWTCRFYTDDTVPEKIRQQLAAEGGQVMTVQGLPSQKYGTFWRFLVADDASVERYLVRDCDSVVNVRERVAVDEWIESQRHFHVMRDFYSHTELVLAGMWGGVARALPHMGRAFSAYVEQTIFHRTLDQEFLRDRIWPTIRQSVLVHDSQFDFGDHRDFPSLGLLPPGQSVGDLQF